MALVENISQSGAGRPELTMPEDAAELLRRHYAAASVILEYGTGGSTALAAEMPDKTTFAVENDPDWHAGLRAYFSNNPPRSTLHLHLAETGPVENWGHPLSDEGWRQWPGYVLSVWDRADFQEPDVILIDGRFRVACFLAAVFRLRRACTVLFDDYVDRPSYHVVEKFAPPTEFAGRMARFDIQPGRFPADGLSALIEAFGQPL
ncbi:MAG: hypothetical protein AAF667_03850 [Pseudomonadota bacterium]